ncbi:MAG: hypothetical protein A3E82_00170 [Gammaproteobacteria bacterium RIFCSPHIGHO2_12_FULL_38_11]|nr:MAG: hypothetical protein A3E82_00170 [Gammaproteobacteria bacterium RIFCSPHIGHO2_12_FULL_38_11]
MRRSALRFFLKYNSLEVAMSEATLKRVKEIAPSSWYFLKSEKLGYFFVYAPSSNAKETEPQFLNDIDAYLKIAQQSPEQTGSRPK